MPDPAVGAEQPEEVVRRALGEISIHFFGTGELVVAAHDGLDALVADRDALQERAEKWEREYGTVEQELSVCEAERDTAREENKTAAVNLGIQRAATKRAEAERDTALRALREARSLHYEVSAAQRSQFDPETRCGECLLAWPCATERLLAVALGGTGVAEGERPCGCPPGESCDECD